MTLWMLKGVHTAKTEARMHALHRSASLISRQIMQTDIYDRHALYMPKSLDAPGFRSTVKTPLMLIISQYCDQWGSQKLEEVLSTSGVGIPYKESNNAQLNLPKECNRTYRDTLGTMPIQVVIGNKGRHTCA